MRILIVEDNKASAATLSKLLKKNSDSVDLDVRTADTLAEGLHLSNTSYPPADITILDLSLPDSPDWHDTVKAIPKFHPPVIVMTGFDLVTVELECYAFGAQDVFSKAAAVKMIDVVMRAITSARLRTVAPTLLNET